MTSLLRDDVSDPILEAWSTNNISGGGLAEEDENDDDRARATANPITPAPMTQIWVWKATEIGGVVLKTAAGCGLGVVEESCRAREDVEGDERRRFVP